MTMAMAMVKKQKKMNFGANKGTRAIVVVLGGWAVYAPWGCYMSEPTATDALCL
jgi:hypothetical protein